MEALAILKLAVPNKYEDLLSLMDSHKFDGVTGILQRKAKHS